MQDTEKYEDIELRRAGVGCHGYSEQTSRKRNRCSRQAQPGRSPEPHCLVAAVAAKTAASRL